MLQSLFILNNTGEIIIEKHYRGLLNRNICDYFWDEVCKAPSHEEVLPILQTPKYYLIHIQRNGLFFLGVCSMEVSPLLIVEYLHRVCDVFNQYFEKLSETSIRENFVVVYQLLDEMMDNGIPFTTEPNALMDMIPPSNILKKVVGGITGQSSMSGNIGEGNLSNTPWRKMGVKYANNEIYLDIIEEIDCTVEPNGLAVNTEVAGEVQVTCKLSGMPDLSLSFSNPHILDDVSFHPCVRYNRYEQHKVVSFVPPDGQFKLMNYIVKGQLQLPIYVKPQITWNQSGGRVSIMVGTKNTGGKPVEDMVVTIPFPKSIASTNLTANFGNVQYDDITKTCKWNIGKIPKDKSPLLEGTISLPPGGSVPDSNPSVSADFKIVMFAVSSLKVDSLALHNERYKPYKGVRSITKAGKFTVRC